MRRQQRERAIQRRYRIVKQVSVFRDDFELTYKCQHWHFRCNCMGQKDGPLARDLRRMAA